MPLSVTCILDKATLQVEDAEHLRDAARAKRASRPDFRCVDCGQAVRVHKAGGQVAAHFEHLRRNPSCPLSDAHREKRKA